MKTKILFFLLGFFMIKANGQNPTMNDINSQLRNMFSQLAQPSPQYNFLYDMAAHQTNDNYFSTNCPDTNQTRDWYKVYAEMYHSAYDTTLVDSVNNVFVNGNQFFSDTVPIGIMNYSFWRLIDSTTLTTNDYFDFDTTNNYLYDKAGRPNSPYIADGIFMASPMVAKNGFTQNITFLIDKKFIYELNPQFSILESSNLKIDFGDGNGWISFNTTVTTYHKVMYPALGNYVIRTAFYTGSATVMQSAARITINHTFTVDPDEIRHYPGLDVGIYGGCDNDGIVKKTIIYLPGFNPLDFLPTYDLSIGSSTIISSYDRTVQDIYASMIQNNQLVQLKNQGYRFVVVKWNRSEIDIRYNALYLMNLIEHLKQEQMDGTENLEQFVIAGESMGGLVGRYALTFMESEYYQTNNYGRFFLATIAANNVTYTNTHLPELIEATVFRFNPERRHNTRLFMTFDTPHQGANVPLSYQLAYKTVLRTIGCYSGIEEFNAQMNIGLESMAAKQMLIYHAETKNITDEYFSHPYKYLFFQDLSEIGNYPRFAKVVALSNGSLAGHGQLNGYTANERVASDHLFDMHISTYVKILWFLKVPIFGTDITLNTNPDGNGLLMNANAGTYGIRIKFHWFGVKIDLGYNTLFSITEYGNKLKPYCVNSGGYYGTIPAPVAHVVDGHDISTSDVFNVFWWHTNDNSAGCHSLDAHLGFNGIFTQNLDYNFCSDGSNFCFIPTQSALDYGSLGTLPLNHNIETENINIKLSRVPASVIIGYPEDEPLAINLSPFRQSFNYPHLNYRNPQIDNIRHNGSHQFYTCSTATGGEVVHNIFRTMLSKEIGDEELYLENCNLNWLSDYHAEYDIHVNDRNRLYEYPSQSFGTFPNMIDGVYSKQNPFNILHDGFARFHYDYEPLTSPTGIGINISTPIPDPARFGLFNEPQYSCCRDFFVPHLKISTNNINTPNSYLKLYPNPNSTGNINIAYQFKKNGTVQMQVYDVMGILYYNKEWLGADATKENTRSFNQLNLHNGIYFVRLSNGNEVLHQQLIINK